MESKMEILAEVTYRHGYFTDQLCRGLSANLAGGVSREMLGHGLLLKTKPGGFTLLYDARHVGSERTKAAVLGRGIVIRLLLRLNDPEFYNYTMPAPDDAGNQVFYFYNSPGHPFLHAKERVSAEDLYFFTSRRVGREESEFPGDKWILQQRAGDPKKIVMENREGPGFVKPFAILDLRLEPWMDEENYLFFQPPSTRWNYILVGDHLKDLNNPAIINSSTSENFTGPSLIRLRDQRTGLSFISPAPLGLREEPAGTCMLVENFDPATGKYKVVTAALPGPDVRIISAARAPGDDAEKEKANDEYFSEIILY
jgi:hypothetical protein